MAIDFFADAAVGLPAPVPTTAPAKTIDFFSDTPDINPKSLMEITDRYQQKAIEATDPDLKQKLDDVSIAAANTLEPKPGPIDFFAGTPETPTPVTGTSRTFGDFMTATPVYKASPRGGKDTMLESAKGIGSDFIDFFKGIGTSIGMLGSVATAMDPLASKDPNNLVAQQGKGVLGAANVGASKYYEDLMTKPVKTAVRTAGTLIGGEGVADLLSEGDTTKILEHPAGTLLQVLLAAPALKPLAYGAAVTTLTRGRSIIAGSAGGEKLLGPVDWLGRKVLPKYGFTNEMYGLEAETAGKKFLSLEKDAKPNAIAAGELVASNPKAAPFMTPELEMSRQALREINRGYNKHMQTKVGVGPWNTQVGPEFAYKKRNLDVVIDHEGRMRYGSADEFNALTQEEQRKIFNARNKIDAGMEDLYKRGILTDEEFSKGAWSYAHDTYRVFHNEADWLHEIKTNPATQPIWNVAHAKLSKSLKNPLDQALPATAEQVDNEMWAILRQARELKKAENVATVQGPADSAVAALIRRKKIPPEIKNLLGRMEGEFMPVRIGETIAMQNNQILTDTMLSKMEGMVGFDGRPLIIRPQEVTLKPPKPTAQPVGPFWSSAETREKQFAHPAPMGRDYSTLKSEGPGNPLWGRRWTNAQIHPDVIDAVHVMNSPEISGIFAKYLQLWKASKVADNIPTHINNMFGDVQYSTYIGASAANPQNWAHYARNGPDIFNYMTRGEISPRLEQFMSVGIMRPGLAAAEMGADYAKIMHPGSAHGFSAWIDRYLHWKGQSGLSQTYDMEDQFFRIGSAEVLMNKGMTLREAAIEINKYYPSYDVTSPVGNLLRGRGKLGPIPAGVGAFIGGPFTSFPMENMRIALLASKEHPIRFAATNMMPAAITALGMGASGLTIDDYHELLRKQPPYMQGKLLIPVPLPNGKIGFIDWTQAIPGADMNVRKEAFGFGNQMGSIAGVPTTVPAPQGMLFSGPGWAMLNAIQNRNPQTGQPIMNPAKGQMAMTWLDYLTTSILPFPTSVIDAAKRTKHYVEDTQSRKYEEGPQSGLRIPFQSFIPQVGNYRTIEDLQKEARVVKRGRLGELKGGFKSIGKDRTLSDTERQERKEVIRGKRQDIKEGFK